MLLAAEEIDAFNSIYQNWPFLGVLGAAFAWVFKSVVKPLSERHISFIDGLEVRDRMTAENGIKQTVLLESLFGESKEHSDRLSRIERSVEHTRAQTQPACPIAMTPLDVPKQPTVGG